MQLYDTTIDEIKAFQVRRGAQGELKTLSLPNHLNWPSAGDRNLILQSDTAIELGNPVDEAVALSIWTEIPGKVVDERITLIGPDLNEAVVSRLPFGKIVLLEGDGFDEENAYDRYRQLDLIRFDVSLKGYMMRAASQYKKEWSRISHDAVDHGFSFSVLGKALITEFKKVDYIKAVEIFFITSSNEDVSLLNATAARVTRINQAMSKMTEEMSTDCAECEYEDVCDEVSALRSMRNNKTAGRELHA